MLIYFNIQLKSYELSKTLFKLNIVLKNYLLKQLMSSDITKEDFINLGIHSSDPRFENVDEDNFTGNNFTSKYLKGQLSVNNWDELKLIIEQIYNEVKDDNKGDVASYIPELAEVDDE